MPALQSITARHVPPNQQAELQGSIVSLGTPGLGHLYFHFDFAGVDREAGWKAK